MEVFLKGLKDRGCNFHVVWFDNHEQLCVPSEAPSDEAYKYHLTRAILIQHLAQHEGGDLCFRFPNLQSQAFKEYLDLNTVCFILCADDASERGSAAIHSRAFMYNISSMGYSIALFNGLRFLSSKVCLR